MKVCITGSAGLIGSFTALRFLNNKHSVTGVDNNMRRFFFGDQGDTSTRKKILSKYPNYLHKNLDIRDKKRLEELFRNQKFDVVVHTAGQPSHDKARTIPLIDFEVNALGTLNLLEVTRVYCPKAVFIYTSTNKVYGNNPNKIKLIETPFRFMPNNKKFKGFAENLSIDQNLHSLMGASKLSADIYVQEYGKNFGLKTTVLRLGCVSGKLHAGVKEHGFLSYLVKSLIHKNTYEIIGFKGKQVRDQIHADDVVSAFEKIVKKPNHGEVFNLGGGKKNSASILELINLVSKKTGINPNITFNMNPRVGDHIYYVTDNTKFQKYYPGWKISKNLNQMVDEIIEFEKNPVF